MSDVTIVALGDSTTAGTPGFKSPLEAPPDGAGDATSQYAYWLMRARHDWRVLNRGVNDIYQGRSAASVVRELEAMYVAAFAARIPAVAGSIIPYDTAGAGENARMRAVNDWIRSYAAAHPREMVFCDTRAAVAAPGAPDRLAASPDGLHPSPEGYRRMAEALDPAIACALTLA